VLQLFGGNQRLYVIATLTGFAAGFVAWCVGSYLISLFIYHGATRAKPMSEKALKAYEIILCGLLFAACFGVLLVVAHALWPEGR
jgi:hypothetical protein